MQRLLLRLCVPLVALGSLHAQVHEQWVRSYDPSGAYDRFDAVDVAPSGSLYAAGQTGIDTALTLKYDASGTLLWSRTFSSLSNVDMIRAIAIDPSDESVYGVGRADEPGFPTGALALKYDASGNLVWSRVLHTQVFGESTQFYAARLRSNGNLVAGGSSHSTLYAAEFDPLGNLLWRTDGIAGPGYVQDLTLDALGNVVVVGKAELNGSVSKFAVAKFSPTGALLWSRNITGGGVGGENATAVTTDASGAVYVVGQLADLFGFRVSAVVKFAPDGTPAWTQTYHGNWPTTGYASETPESVVLAANGNIRVAGTTSTAANDTDLVVSEYTPSGSLVWQTVWAGAAGRLELGGELSNEADGSMTVLARSQDAAGAVNPAVLRFDANGVLSWASVHPLFAGPNGYINAMQNTSDGTRVFAGWVQSTPAYNKNVILLVERDEFFTFCTGDGASIACPCGNNGAPGRGCGNSAFASGAHLSAIGVASVSGDNVTLSTTSLTGSVGIFFQGATQTAPAVIDDGIGCVGGPLVRLGTSTAGGGSATYPDIGQQPISVRGAIPALGGTYSYQCFYRNASSTFCPPATSNRTNGVAITWAP